MIKTFSWFTLILAHLREDQLQIELRLAGVQLLQHLFGVLRGLISGRRQHRQRLLRVDEGPRVDAHDGEVEGDEEGRLEGRLSQRVVDGG